MNYKPLIKSLRAVQKELTIVHIEAIRNGIDNKVRQEQIKSFTTVIRYLKEISKEVNKTN